MAGNLTFEWSGTGTRLVLDDGTTLPIGTYLLATAQAVDSAKLEGHDASYFATSSALGDYLPLIGGDMSGPIHAPGTGYDTDVALDIFATGESFARLALNHTGEIIFGDGVGGVGPILSFDSAAYKLDIRNYGVKLLDIDMVGNLYNHQTNAGIPTASILSGGDLLLSGNSGTANIKICGSVLSNTAGAAPYLYFAGVSTGVGPSGGGMMMQLNSTNGLDVWSWNNTAWVRKSTLTSAGTIAVVGGTASQFLKANGSIDSTTYLSANQTIKLTGQATGSGTTSIAVTLSNAAVTGQVLTGYSAGTNVAILTTDTILVGFAKAQGQINARLPLTGGTISGVLTLQNNLVLPRGSFRDMVGSTSYTAYYGAGVTPTANNYSIAVNQSGADTTLNSSNMVLLCVNNAAVVNATNTGVAVSGVLTTTQSITAGAGLTCNGWLVQPDIVLRPYTTAGYGAIYGVTANGSASSTNYSLVVARDGATAQLNGTVSVGLNISNVEVLRTTAGGVTVSGALYATTTTSGNAKICAWSVSPATFAFFGHSSQDNSTNGNSGVLQANNGAIYLCAPTGTSVNVQVANVGRVFIDASGLAVTGNLSATGALSYNAGIFRDFTASSTFSCLYMTGITASSTNYSLAIEKNGNTTYLNGIAGTILAVNGVAVATATPALLSVTGGINSTVSVQTPVIKSTGDLNVQSPLTFGASAAVMITSAGYTLPAATTATQTIMVYGESVGPVTNYLRVPAGATWSLWARNDAGDRIQYVAGQQVNMIFRAGLLIAGPYIAGVGCDWHLIHV